MANATVNDKSTKTEIWEAYKRLLAEAKERPAAASEDPAKLQHMAQALQEAKAALLGRFDTAIERLSGIQQSYAETDQELARRKVAALDAIERDKQQLEEQIAVIRKAWEHEKADRELQRQREEDTYAYNLARKRRDDTEAYERTAREREASLSGRETALAEREQKADTLAKEAETFPSRLEQAVKAAREETTKILKAEHAAELKEAKQQADHEKSILALKLQTADAGIAAQAKQLADLQRQLDASLTQLKDMAVTVIQQAKGAPAGTPNPAGQ